MKKIISLALVLVMLLSLTAITASADDFKILFTPTSRPRVGSTMTIDEGAMMQEGSITSDAYNALLEGNVMVDWFLGETLIQEGSLKNNSALLLTADHGNQTIRVKMTFYTDSSYTEACGSVEHTFTVQTFEPIINNAALPDACVGDSYYVELDCQDPNATFSQIMGSQLSEFGLTLSSDGKITGTFTKAGNCHVNILASGEGGEYSVSYDITVSEKAAEPPVITTKTLPEAQVGKDYAVKLVCSDADAVFGEYYNPGKANDLKKTGLVLTQHGDLEGKPTQAGSFTFTVYVSGEGGEDYMTYTLVVKEAAATTDPSTDPTTDPTTDPSTDPTTDPTTNPTTDTPTEPTKPVQSPTVPQQNPGDPGDSEGQPWWVYALIAFACLALGAGIALLVVLLVTKRKNP